MLYPFLIVLNISIRFFCGNCWFLLILVCEIVVPGVFVVIFSVFKYRVIVHLFLKFNKYFTCSISWVAVLLFFWRSASFSCSARRCSWYMINTLKITTNTPETTISHTRNSKNHQFPQENHTESEKTRETHTLKITTNTPETTVFYRHKK